MFIKQISVFVENRSGRIADVINALSSNGINISALFIADTSDFGIVRMITSDFNKSAEVLKRYGAVTKVTDVIGIAVPDTPGGLSGILSLLKSSNIEIEYMYAFSGKSSKGAPVVIKTSDNKMTAECFKNNGIVTINTDDICVS